MSMHSDTPSKLSVSQSSSVADRIALDIVELDRRSYLHPFTAIQDQARNGAFITQSGEGCWVRDRDGRAYLDGAAGLWCVNAGYGRQEIVEAISRQASSLAYYHSFNTVANEPSVLLADRILSLAPADMQRVFFGSSGSDANDTAVKVLWTYNILRGKPDKRKIISRHRAYHGVTVASGSLTGIPMVHKDFGLPLDFARHIQAPDLYRDMAEKGCSTERQYSQLLAEELDALIVAEGPDTVAGMFMEPVMGTGGVLPPPDGYVEAVSTVLERHDVRLVADEVITGFGRIGSWFATSKFAIPADLILTAKGLTSGYLPLSAVLVGDRIWSVLKTASEDGRPFAHGFTYSGHPVCAAAALTNLEIIEREGLVDRATIAGEKLRVALDDKVGDLACVGDIRSEGLMLAVEIVANRNTKQSFPADEKTAPRIALAAREKGVLIRALPNADILALSPPLTISDEEIGLVARTVREAIEVTSGLSS